MRAHRIFLGLSLPTLSALPGGDDAIIDFWEGGSLLYGSDLMRACADYLPILSQPEERECVERLCGEVTELSFEEVVIGDAGDIGAKLSLSADVFQRNWLLSGPRKGFVPTSGWCRCYRGVLASVAAKKLVGLGIAGIDIDARRVVTYLRRDVVEADEIISTMPLPYVLRKAGYSVSDSDFPHEPLHVSLFLVRNSGLREPKVFLLAKLRFGGIIAYVIPDTPFSGYTSIYHISSERKLKFSGLQERAFSDIKRLGIINTVNDVVAERHIIIRYGLLGKPTEEGLSAAIDAEKRGLKTAGRLGRWEEMSVCESYLDGLRLRRTN